MNNAITILICAFTVIAGVYPVNLEGVEGEFTELQFRAEGAILAVIEAEDGIFPETVELKDSYYVAPEGCISCQLCVGACPVQAISMDDCGKAVIDPELCINCGICAGTCPVGTIKPFTPAMCQLYGIDAEGNETLLQESFEED